MISSTWMGDHSSVAVDAVVNKILYLRSGETKIMKERSNRNFKKEREKKIHSLAQVAF